jgi:hypothetical protein
MNRSLTKRVQKLETKAFVHSYGCVREDDIDRRARTKMRASDLNALGELIACRPEKLTAAQLALWNRWEKARREAIREATGGATFVIVLSADDWKL